MGNLALHSAEEPDNLKATTGTVEVPVGPIITKELNKGGNYYISHVARCGEAANVKTARHVFCVDLVLRGCSC